MPPALPRLRALPPRVPGLDVARALAVVAMVVGHTLDVVLAPSVRAEPGLATYEIVRGFTAPLFLMTSGWALVAYVQARQLAGLEVVRSRCGRVLLLLVIGYALRWPGWGLGLLLQGDVPTWAHFLAFDALHLIAVSMVVVAAVLALPWRAGLQAGALLGLAALVVIGGGPSATPSTPAGAGSIVALAVAQAFGGSSPFPIAPWSAHVMLGAALGLVVRGERRDGDLLLLLSGVVLTFGVMTGFRGRLDDLRLLFLVHTGGVLMLFAALRWVPRRLATRLAPLGRASLGVYVVHTSIVYGWSTHGGLVTSVGPTLSLGRALGVAVAVLLVSAGIAAVVGAAPRRLRKRQQAGEDHIASALGPAGAIDRGVTRAYGS